MDLFYYLKLWDRLPLKSSFFFKLSIFAYGFLHMDSKRKRDESITRILLNSSQETKVRRTDRKGLLHNTKTLPNDSSIFSGGGSSREARHGGQNPF